MGYAFISYSTKNRESADFIRYYFNKNGIEVWMAPYNIPAGSKYAAVITQAIRDCSCFVLLLSNASQESVAVDSEVELAALTFKKPFITVELEKVTLNDAFTFYIHNKQIIPLYSINESSYELQQILNAVRGYTAKETKTAAFNNDNIKTVIPAENKKTAAFNNDSIKPVLPADNKNTAGTTESWAEAKRLNMIARYLLNRSGYGLKTDGTIFLNNPAGELAALTGWNDISAVYPGKNFTVGLKNDGTVVATGRSNFWQKPLHEFSGIKAASVGEEHILLLSENGTVTGLGRNKEGQCDTSEWRNIKKAKCGFFHSVGLRENGTVVACGWNDCGQCNVSDWTGIVEIQVGREHTFGFRADGSVLVAGNNRLDHAEIRSWKNISEFFFSTHLAIGIKTDGTMCYTGTLREQLQEVVRWRDIVQLASSPNHCVGLTSHGTVLFAGDPSSGKCQVSDWTDIIAVFAGEGFTLGLRKDGTIAVACDDGIKNKEMESWKLFDDIYNIDNERKEKSAIKNAQLAEKNKPAKGRYTVDELMKIREINELVTDKLFTDMSRTIAIDNNHKLYFAGEPYKDCDINDHLYNNEAVSIGSGYLVLLKTDGTVSAVGSNNYNQTEVYDWRNITAISAACRHTLGLRADGTVAVAGKNKDRYGNYIEECAVGSWDNVKAIYATEFASYGLRNDGTVCFTTYCTEYNMQEIEKWRDIKKIIAPKMSSLVVGVKNDGSVVAAGGNYCGIREVTEQKNVYDISTVGTHIAGITYDGHAFAYGENHYGECDVSDWTDIVQISAGHYHTIGLKADGTVVAAGNNENGMCDVSHWRDIVGVYTAYMHTIGLKADGTVVTAGDNQYGQLNVSDWKLFNSIKEEETKLQLAKEIFNDLFGTNPIPAVPEKKPAPEKPVQDNKKMLQEERRSKGLCPYCGGTFKGLFTKKCSSCGTEKDY